MLSASISDICQLIIRPVDVPMNDLLDFTLAFLAGFGNLPFRSMGIRVTLRSLLRLDISSGGRSCVLVQLETGLIRIDGSGRLPGFVTFHPLQRKTRTRGCDSDFSGKISLFTLGWSSSM